MVFNKYVCIYKGLHLINISLNIWTEYRQRREGVRRGDRRGDRRGEEETGEERRRQERRGGDRIESAPEHIYWRGTGHQ